MKKPSTILPLTVLFAALSIYVVKPNYVGRVHCLLLWHNWAHSVKDDRTWFYNPAGDRFPGGYKYHFTVNKIHCLRCDMTLLDKGINDEEVFPINPSEIGSQNAYPRPERVPPIWIGKSITRYANGNLKNEWSFYFGKLNGQGRDYYSDGKIRNEWNAVWDRLDGEARGYYPDGHIQWDDRYDHGKRGGVSREYFKNGQIKFKYLYKNGEAEGPAVMYYSNGVLRREESYSRGRPVGVRRDYDSGGSLKLTKTFDA